MLCSVAALLGGIIGADIVTVTEGQAAATAPAGAGQGNGAYRWTCMEFADGDDYSPTVTIYNTGRRPIGVSDISVAVFSRAGQQLSSVDVSPSGVVIAYIAPGSSLVFPDPGGGNPSWTGNCSVERVS